MLPGVALPVRIDPIEADSPETTGLETTVVSCTGGRVSGQGVSPRARQVVTVEFYGQTAYGRAGGR
jgi:hypothetical protein